MRLRSSSRCSIRLMPGSSARSDTAARALPIASTASTMLVQCLRGVGRVARVVAGVQWHRSSDCGGVASAGSVEVSEVALRRAPAAQPQLSRRLRAAGCAERSPRLSWWLESPADTAGDKCPRRDTATRWRLPGRADRRRRKPVPSPPGPQADRWRSSSFLRRSASSELRNSSSIWNLKSLEAFAELVHQLADLAADLRQPPRPEHHQRHHHQDEESTIPTVPSRIGGCAPMKANDNCPCTALTNVGVMKPHPVNALRCGADATALVKLVWWMRSCGPEFLSPLEAGRIHCCRRLQHPRGWGRILRSLA